MSKRSKARRQRRQRRALKNLARLINARFHVGRSALLMKIYVNVHDYHVDRRQQRGDDDIWF